MEESQQEVLPGTPSYQSRTDSTPPSTSTNNTANPKSKEIIQFHNKNKLKLSELYFQDGIRQIDMVIAFKDTTDEKHQKHRQNFEATLTHDGFELELEDKKISSEGDVYFLKVHAPWEVLCKYAEAMHLKMPLKVNQDDESQPLEENNALSRWTASFRKCFARIRCYCISRKVNKIPPETSRTNFLTAPFVRSRIDNFAIDSTDTFFMPSQRSMLVWHKLCRTPFSRQKQKVGINKLIQMGVYSAAFPLHDGDIGTAVEQWSTREILYRTWGSFGSWYRPQPLGQIRDYFGDQVAMYFAWLGFYSTALIFPAIAGFLCFLYGAVTIDSKDNVVSREICRKSSAGNLIMCPLCSNACPYWLLGDSCIYSKITYLFDNYATGLFAVFMSLWATIYLQMWNRRQARLAWEWDLMESEFGEDEEIRLEYEFTAKSYRISPVTRRREPFMSPWKRVGRFALSGAGVIFLCMILLIAMVILIVYRIASITVFSNLQKSSMRQNAKLLSSISASLINLVGKRLIYFLTVFEVPRTQTEFEDSYIFKVFVFDFVNVYSSFIYIAIFKGRFYLHPGDAAGQTAALTTVRVDVCDPSGCFMELCIQLMIVMIGRQLLNHFLEIIMPILRNWWRRCHFCKNPTHNHSNTKEDDHISRWEKDYLLESMNALSLYEEYLEVVLQYGLVTIFVSAFPLAPFFAIINNLIELRVDSFKFMTQLRRPVARRMANTKNIIDEIMQFVTYFAVISNAFVIAYTSEFIPRLVYYYSYNVNMNGYIKFTLSEFNTSYYGEGMGPLPEVDNRTFPLCYYRAMRNPSNDPVAPHELNFNYWYTSLCRLAFVVVFEHLVFILTGLVAYIIPDIPPSVRDNMIRERLLEREALVAQDTSPKIGSNEPSNSKYENN